MEMNLQLLLNRLRRKLTDAEYNVAVEILKMMKRDAKPDEYVSIPDRVPDSDCSTVAEMFDLVLKEGNKILEEVKSGPYVIGIRLSDLQERTSRKPLTETRCRKDGRVRAYSETCNRWDYTIKEHRDFRKCVSCRFWGDIGSDKTITVTGVNTTSEYGTVEKAVLNGTLPVEKPEMIYDPEKKTVTIGPARLGDCDLLIGVLYRLGYGQTEDDEYLLTKDPSA